MSENYTLPKGKEWATAPLLDPSNVGKYVWPMWNGNRNRGETPRAIVKIGRTNIHVEASGVPWSMRVAPNGETAGGYKGGFLISAETQAWRQGRRERIALMDKVRRISWTQVHPDVIRQVLALVPDDE